MFKFYKFWRLSRDERVGWAYGYSVGFCLLFMMQKKHIKLWKLWSLRWVDPSFRMLHDEATIKGNESIVKWHLNSLLVVFVLIFPSSSTVPLISTFCYGLVFDGFNLNEITVWWSQKAFISSCLTHPSSIPTSIFHRQIEERIPFISVGVAVCSPFLMKMMNCALISYPSPQRNSFQVVEASKCVRRRRSLKKALKINLPLDSLVLYRSSTYTRNMLKF